MFDNNSPMDNATNQKPILFCPYCGTKLDPGANFCKSCGEFLGNFNSPSQSLHDRPTQRETVYEGNIHKCPNCGEVLESFTTNCPTCGYEIRNTRTSDSLREFAAKLERIESQRAYSFPEEKQTQKANLILNYPLPNTKEDIMEFMILASSNIDTQYEIDDAVTMAWISKLDQIIQKAAISLQNDGDFALVAEIYINKQREIKKCLKKMRWKSKRSSIYYSIYFR